MPSSVEPTEPRSARTTARRGPRQRLPGGPQLTPARSWRAVAAGAGSAAALDTALAEAFPAPRPSWIALSPAARRALAVAFVACVVLAGIALRFVPAGALWFDETQALSIARLPLSGLFHGLRQDASPPLYYLLLHWWMALFGTGTASVRVLSGLTSVAALPPVWLLARRVLPRWTAVAALVLVASSPMFIRYALEARMYALEPLVIALAGLALLNVLERPTPWRVSLLALASASLFLTHYWMLFLIGTVVVGLAWHAVRGSRRHGWALLGVLAGGLAFIPWIPSMVFQIEHTGTPWSHAAIYDILEAIPAFGGADELTNGLIIPTAAVLVPVLLGLVVYGGRKARSARVSLWLTIGTLAAAGVTSVVLGAAVVPRYISVALLPYLFVAAAGIAVLPRGWREGVLATVAVLGLVTGYIAGVAPRTLAPQVAATLQRYGHPADTVLYCPDQIASDTSRLLPGWSHQRVFPTGGYPGRVDWVDYEARNLRSHPTAFARQVVAESSGQPIWLLESNAFVEYHGRCGQLARSLGALRPSRRQMLTGSNPMDPSEPEGLIEYLPRSAPAATAAARG